MNKRQKELIQARLDNEDEILKELKKVYEDALNSVNQRIAYLLGRSDADLPHVIYQVKYQLSLKKQINGILDDLNSNQYIRVSEYLAKAYEDGYIGTLYDIQGQGVPIVTPIDQELVTKAISIDTKLSEPLYERLGVDVSDLKKKISSSISRGIAQNLSYADIAKSIARDANVAMNNAMRITRTEAGRISSQASLDAQEKAKEEGADIVKQWDATLDGKTRPHHRELDGQIRELNEDFVIPSTGARASAPHMFGKASEDINCRCVCLQRARIALEGGFSKMNNFTKQLEVFESPKSYGDFKKAFFSDENVRYMNYMNTLQERYNTKDLTKLLGMMTEREYNHYSKLLSENPIYNVKTDGE